MIMVDLQFTVTEHCSLADALTRISLVLVNGRHVVHYTNQGARIWCTAYLIIHKPDWCIYNTHYFKTNVIVSSIDRGFEYKTNVLPPVFDTALNLLPILVHIFGQPNMRIYLYNCIYTM
jgi:hypothetical protein